MPTFGFILTRHVNSQETNAYWNQSVKLLRNFYPHSKIVVIDDGSNMQHVSADHDYKNVEIVTSEYPKRGELLPYVYYLRHKWFDYAIILHDSVFFNRRIPFEKYLHTIVALPLWHAQYDCENPPNIFRELRALRHGSELARYFKNAGRMSNYMLDDNDAFLRRHEAQMLRPIVCFGGQSIISLRFLEHCQEKYQITNLTNVIQCRTDRCTFERVIGVIFWHECLRFRNAGCYSLFGNIFRHYRAFAYRFADYMQDFRQKKARGRVVKVWTGR